MMSLKSKHELLEGVRPRYLKASKLEKQKIPGRRQGKNWSVVRHTVGYDRSKTGQELVLLEEIYEDLRLYINFFQPSFKLIAKERIGNKTIHLENSPVIFPFDATLPFIVTFYLDAIRWGKHQVF